MEPRLTHLAARSSGIEASAVTEGWVHTLAPIEAGEQVCKGDRGHVPIKLRTAEHSDAAPSSCWGPCPSPPRATWNSDPHRRQPQHSFVASFTGGRSGVPWTAALPPPWQALGQDLRAPAFSRYQVAPRPTPPGPSAS